MDIHLMKIFVSVFMEKSVSKAAEKLYISQPTVTEHIKRLEELLGKKLFVRVSKGIKPTEYALEIFPKINKVINKYDLLIGFLNVNKNVDKKIVIGSSSVPEIVILPKVIEKFNNMYSDVRFNIIVSDSIDIIKKVLSYEVVLGFVGTVIKDDKLIFEKILDDELIIAAKEGFFKKDIIDIDDLFKHKAIFREEGSGTRKEVENYLKAFGVSIKKINTFAIVNKNDLYINLIKQGLAYGFISKIVAEINGLSTHKLRGVTLKRGIFAVYRKNMELSEEYRLLLEVSRNDIV